MNVKDWLTSLGHRFHYSKKFGCIKKSWWVHGVTREVVRQTQLVTEERDRIRREKKIRKTEKQ